jgi:hypothetical protein
VLDGHGFRARTREAQQDIIGIAHVAQSLVAWILRIATRRRPHRLPAGVCLGRLPLGLEPCGFCVLTHVCPMMSSDLACGIAGQQYLLDILVPSGKVDVREERADHTPLWRTTEGGMLDPWLQIACLQEILDDPQKPMVLDLLAQNRHKDPVVETVEARRDITLDAPDDARPPPANLR